MRKRTLTLMPLLLLWVGAAAGAEGTGANRLTDKERKDGWELLFDGKVIDKWRGYQRPDMAGLRWEARDGCLMVPGNDGKDTKGARDILSVKTYDDFELTWEWKVAPGGNSGLKYLVSETGPVAFGHEYQMIDDARHPDAQKRDSRRTGSFYDVIAAPAAKPRPAGELNQSRVVLQGKHVEHWLNGAKIVEYELDSEPLRAAIASSKFKTVEGFDKPRRAHILLQDHGDSICYRNIKIREPKRK